MGRRLEMPDDLPVANQPAPKRKRRTIPYLTPEEPEKDKPVALKIHLKSHEDLRRLLSSVANMLRRKEIAVDRARALIYLVSVAGDIIDKLEFDDRLKRLEDLSASCGR